MRIFCQSSSTGHLHSRHGRRDCISSTIMYTARNDSIDLAAKVTEAVRAGVVGGTIIAAIYAAVLSLLLSGGVLDEEFESKGLWTMGFGIMEVMIYIIFGLVLGIFSIALGETVLGRQLYTLGIKDAIAFNLVGWIVLFCFSGL